MLAPLRRLGGVIVGPLVEVLARAGVHPNALSLSQIPLGLAVAALIPRAPVLALGLFAAALLMDFLDGALARRSGAASTYGALVDQVADHVRELTVIGGLTLAGALRGEIGVAYAMAYPLANFLLYAADRVQRPPSFSVKPWLAFYPFLALYLLTGTNALNYAAAAAAGFMLAASAHALWNVRGHLTADDG